MTARASSPVAYAGSIHRTGVDQAYFAMVVVCLVVLNVFTFLYHYTGATVFNAISNFVSVLLLAYSLRVISKGRADNGTAKTFLLFAVVMTSLSVLCNLAVASLVDALKYLSIYIFYAAGRACGGQIRPLEIRCMFVLAALPLTFLGVGTSKPFANESFASEVFAYLPNANTGVLYFSALLFALAQRYGDRIILVQFFNAVVMNRMGAVLATALAVGVWIAFPIRRQSIAAAIVLGLAVCVAYPLGAFDRVLAVLDNVMFVGSIDPRTVASMSYKELVQMTGSTDLSAFFRLIHWSNIWNLYTTDGIVTLLFGYGVGQTPFLTYATLVPHNDYLRILAEYGPFNLVIFVSFLLHIRGQLSTGAAKVLFVVLCIYFFSENLLDNFTSMALYFAYAGRAAANRLQPGRPGRRALAVVKA